MRKNSPILGLDFGQKRIGVAVSDSEEKMAFSRETIVYQSLKEALAKIREISEEEGIKKIIVGLPLGLKGEKTKQTRLTQEFIVRLKSELSLTIESYDERLTTKMAQRLLQKSPRRKQKGEEDRICAQILLQNYLDQKSL